MHNFPKICCFDYKSYKKGLLHNLMQAHIHYEL